MLDKARHNHSNTPTMSKGAKTPVSEIEPRPEGKEKQQALDAALLQIEKQ